MSDQSAPRSSPPPPSGNPVTIATPDDYEMALSEIEELVDLDPPADSAFGRELIRLSSLVQEYEKRPATPSSPETRGTIKATAVPGTLPDTAPFVWDETPAELTEALDRLETLIAEAEHCPPNVEVQYEDLIIAAHDALVSIYNRQREEIERLTAQNAASLEEQSWLVKELSRLRVDRGAEDQIMALDQQIGMLQAENTSLSTHLERLKAELPTPAEARLCLHVLKTTGHGVSITHPLVAKLQQIGSRASDTGASND